MKLKDIMSTALIVCQETNTVNEVAQLMLEHDIGFVPIAKNDEIVGIITDRDIIINAISNNDTGLINNYMTTNLINIDQNKSLEEALKIMGTEQIKRLLITDNKKLVGIVSISDFLKTKIEPETLIASMKKIWKIKNNDDRITPKVNEFKL